MVVRCMMNLICHSLVEIVHKLVSCDLSYDANQPLPVVFDLTTSLLTTAKPILIFISLKFEVLVSLLQQVTIPLYYEDYYVKSGLKYDSPLYSLSTIVNSILINWLSPLTSSVEYLLHRGICSPLFDIWLS